MAIFRKMHWLINLNVGVHPPIFVFCSRKKLKGFVQLKKSPLGLGNVIYLISKTNNYNIKSVIEQTLGNKP